MSEKSLSIVIPAFNEAPNVIAQAQEILQALSDWKGDVEILYVDDGSTDETAEKVMEASKNDDRVRLVKLERNRGQVPAMAEGIEKAKGEIIVTMDADRQHDPRDIPALATAVLSGLDMVCGWRKDRQDPFWGKIVPSRIFNLVLRILFRVPIHDASCTMRAFRPEALRSIRLYWEAISFIPILCAKAGFKIGECVIRHRPRAAGQAKYDSPQRFVYTLKEMFKILFGQRDKHLPGGK